MADKRYLERLENITKIVETGKAIVDYEIEIDKLKDERIKINKKIAKYHLKISEIQNKNLKNQKQASSNLQLPQQNHLKRIDEIEQEISCKQTEMLTLQQIMEDEVRTGIAEMFHEAKVEHEKILKNVMKIKEMSSRAQKEFQAKQTKESHKSGLIILAGSCRRNISFWNLKGKSKP